MRREALGDKALVHNYGHGGAGMAADARHPARREPARGQLAILLPQPEVRYAFTGEAGYMFPRPDGILPGGTFERGQWSTTAEPARIARILATHRRLFSGFRCTA